MIRIRRVNSFNLFPTLELMPPGGNFKSIDGRLTIQFFRLNLDNGRYEFHPHIIGNVSFSYPMSASEAEAWSKVFDFAARIVTQHHIYFNVISSSDTDDLRWIVELVSDTWKDVETIRKEYERKSHDNPKPK